MLNGQNMTTRTGRLGQDNRVGTTVAVEIGHLGQDHSDRTSGTGHPGQDSRYRTAGTGQSGQDSLHSLDRTVWTDWPGQVSQEKDMIMSSGELWSRFPRQGSWNRTAGTGQRGQDRRVRTGNLGPDNWERTAETGRPDR
jgi:hypothetical protein